MAKPTHKTRLLDYLTQHGSITSLEAIRDLGNTRLSATVFTPRQHAALCDRLHPTPRRPRNRISTGARPEPLGR
jgi:hypothetical protein